MNKPVVQSSGLWMLPVALWDRERERYPELDPQRLTNVVASEDQGRTWEWRGGAKTPADVRTWDEHMVVERADGGLWMLIRTRYGIGESTSPDRGKTWTETQPSPLVHTSSRFFLRRLASDRLLLVKHGSISQNAGRSHLSAFLSEDDGQTWTGGLMLDEREGVSYPDGTQAPDGTVYIIYDYSRTGAKEILMSTFTEADVAAGRPVSGRTRMRALVNKATGTQKQA